MLTSLGGWLVGSRRSVIRWFSVLSAGYWTLIRRGYRRSVLAWSSSSGFGVSVRWPLGCVIFWRKPFRPPGYHRSGRRVTSGCRWLFTRWCFDFAALYVSSDFRLFLWRWTSSTSGVNLSFNRSV